MHLSIAIMILILLLLGPIFFRVVEENLEADCFVLGIVAIGLSGSLDWHLAERALSDPIPISIAVLVAALLVYCRLSLQRRGELGASARILPGRARP